MAAQIAIDAASRASARARVGRLAILSAADRVRAPHPLAFRPPAVSAPQCGWLSPSGEAYVAWGEAHALATGDPGAAPALAGAARAALDAVEGPGRELARFFGGLAFAGGGTPLGGRCPAGRFVLPAAIVRFTSEGATAAVFHRVRPGEEPEAAEAALAEAWQALLHPVETGLAPSAEGGAPSWPAVRHVDEDPAAWTRSVEAALAAIAAGEVGKVVLARPIRLRAEAPWQPWEVFAALAERAPGTHRFLFQDGDGVAFLGASPERLFAEAAGEVQVDCLAGTAPRGADPDEDDALGAALLASDKDRREHDWVVRAVREALAPHTAGLQCGEAPALMRLPTVQHLHTPVRAALAPGATLEDLLAALHPTPAVGGSPRAAALALLARLEGTPRGWYAGPVGFITADAAAFAVAIRSAYVQGHEAAVMAGAGIVAGSEPAREWDETARKAAPLVRLLTEGPA